MTHRVAGSHFFFFANFKNSNTHQFNLAKFRQDLCVCDCIQHIYNSVSMDVTAETDRSVCREKERQ